ncbi:MAG: TonB-dependent receptor [Bryobacteraceae bacterium]|nr:TonB-dependent receptor [Bryobacterales bacterium]NUM99923.1 TonB-dependent receptor [Bryobacteraceae bacterium]
MRNVIIRLSVLSCLFAGFQAAAQPPVEAAATLIVKVQDSNRSPVVGATVHLGEPGWGRRARRRHGWHHSGDQDCAGARCAQVTDAKGETVFRGLTAGGWPVVASAESFFPNEARIALIAGQETVLTIELQRRPVVSETVVVTGSGTESLVQEAPIRTELITPRVVERQIKTTLAEAFQATISGVRTEMNCQNCGFMQLRMNGLEGPYTQILEDGLPSYSGVASVYGLEQVPAAFLDQIEVVKGGNSALYGPGAVGGVVNLIRREPRENHFRIDTLTGWHFGRPEQQLGASAQLAQLPASFAGDFYYRGSNRVAIDRDRDGFSDIGKRRLQSGGFGLFRRFVDGKARLSITGTVADEFRRGGDQLDRPPHETWITEQIESRRYSTAIGWNHALSAKTYYNLRGSHAYYGRQTYYGAGMDPNAYGNTRNPLWVGDAQLAHQAGKHSLLGGYQISWEHVEDNAPAYGRTYGGTFQNHGVYLQDEWRATARVSVIGGARFDKSNQIDRWIVSPRVGTKLGITDNLVWRATLSTGFRAPAVFDEDLHIAQVGGEGFILQNDAGLREEKAVSFGTGMQYLGMVRERKYQIGFNIFYTDLRHAFTLVEDDVPGQAFRRLLRVNGPGAHVAGVDFDGTIQLSRRLGLRGGVTVQQARWKESEAQFGARDFFRAPKRYGFLGLDWDLPHEIEVTGTADFTGSMLIPHYAGYINEDRLETSKRFGVFNAVVSKTFTVADASKIRLFFNMQNIGDSYQRDLDPGPSRDSAYVYGPAEMRRAVVGLTYEF